MQTSFMGWKRGGNFSLIELFDHKRPINPVHLVNVFKILFKNYIKLNFIIKGWVRRGLKRGEV
jgi:hypothetical protein